MGIVLSSQNKIIASRNQEDPLQVKKQQEGKEHLLTKTVTNKQTKQIQL